jgi:hypothetical protein
LFACGVKKEVENINGEKITREEMMNEFETNYNAFSNVKVGMHFKQFLPNSTVYFRKKSNENISNFICIVDLEIEKTVYEVSGNNYKVLLSERGKVLIGSDSRCKDEYSKTRESTSEQNNIIAEIKNFKTFDLNTLSEREYFKKTVDNKTTYIIKGKNNHFNKDNMYGDTTVELDPTLSIIFNPRLVNTKVYVIHRNKSQLVLEQNERIEVISK